MFGDFVKFSKLFSHQTFVLYDLPYNRKLGVIMKVDIMKVDIMKVLCLENH